MCEVNKCIKSIVISSTVDCYSEDVAPLAISSFFFIYFFISPEGFCYLAHTDY